MLNRIVDIVADHRAFLVTTHESPDGDAVGSSLALANYLTGLGKDVVVYMCDPVPELYRFLPMAEQVVSELPDREFEVCFVLDIGEFRRAGEAIVTSKRIGMIVNLDHHRGCEEFGTLNLIDPQACATGALVYRLIRAAGHEVDYATALCIYTAVITDTGSFRYSNANSEAFAIAGSMVAAGVNAWFIAERLYESQPRARLELLAQALTTLTISPCGTFASLTVTLDMYAKSGATAELTDGFVNYPRSIQGVEVAIFFREISAGLYKVGFRSKGKVDVSALAAHFGGGGHHNAAGCTIQGDLVSVRDQLFSHLATVL
jgi:phosphoesterase RecJ-like protein